MKTARLPQIREVRRLYTGGGRYTKGNTNRHEVYIAVEPEQIEVEELWSNANQLYPPVAPTKTLPRSWRLRVFAKRKFQHLCSQEILLVYALWSEMSIP